MSCGDVVPQLSGVTEEEFRAAMQVGLARASKSLGKKALAYVMDFADPRQLRNITNGSSTPEPKRLWDVLPSEPSILDEIAALYNKKLVPIEYVCSSAADLSVSLAGVLSWLANAQHPNSPGGSNVIHTEKLNGEDGLRKLRDEIDKFLGECSRLRVCGSAG